MSVWVPVFVALAVIGLGVLAMFTWRLWRQVRALGKTVSAAGERIAEAQIALNSISGDRTGNARETYTQ